MRSVLLFSAILLSTFSAPADWTGSWNGHGKMGDERISLSIEIASDGGALTARMSLPEHGWLHAPAHQVRQEGDSLIIEVDPRSEHVLQLNGADELSGTWKWKAFDAALSLAPAMPDLPYTREELGITRDGISFGGTLFLPKGPGPHPAMVCFHGSGDNERWWLFDEADRFARMGLACYVFDKRGCGESGGHWEEADFAMLAEDGIAAVSLLRSRGDIDPERIGVFGISQACWIMPLAATKSEDIAFIVAVSGAVTTVEEEGYYDYWYRMREAGFSEEDWQEALALLKRNNAFTRTGEGWEELMGEMRACREKPWWSAAEITPAPKGSIWRSFYRGIVDFDPVPYIRELKVPIIWLHGGADDTAPTHRSAELLRNLVAEDESLPFTLVWLEEANHGMRVPARAGSHFPLQPYHSRYWPAVEEWLAATVLNH
jgi:pimeloyl-ACP methyl ester carboxylesterase